MVLNNLTKKTLFEQKHKHINAVHDKYKRKQHEFIPNAASHKEAPERHFTASCRSKKSFRDRSNEKCPYRL